MKDEEVFAEIDSLLLDFSSLETVKKYKKLKNAVEEDEKLREMERKRTTMQKGIKYLKDEKKDACMKACKELQIEHDNSPLFVNYLSAKKEVYSLLAPFDNIVL